MSGVAVPALSRRLKYLGTTYASARPWLYYGLRQAVGKFDPLCVTQRTDLVIEGYPRSANSTTVYGLLDRQERSMKIAHHKHHVAQLLRGVEWEIPSVVLIREPRAAVVSLRALWEEGWERSGRTQRPPSVGLPEVLWEYVVFYRHALTIAPNLVIAPFEEVTEDISPLISRINIRFDMDLAETSSPKDSTYDLGYHARPNEVRNEIKARISDEFTDMLKSFKKMRQLELSAQKLRESILEIHARSR